MPRFLARMGAHRFLLEADTLDEADKQLDGRLMMVGLERTDSVTFETFPADPEEPAA